MNIPVFVECHSGYRGEETPRRFRFNTATIDVQEVMDRWLAPDHRYFKVRGSDGAVYILRHDVGSWRWELTFFRDGSSLPQAAGNLRP